MRKRKKAKKQAPGKRAPKPRRAQPVKTSRKPIRTRAPKPKPSRKPFAKPARRRVKKPLHRHHVFHHAPRPFARVLVPVREGIPVAIEPFEPPKGFWTSLKADLDHLLNLLGLVFKAGEPPKTLPPVDEIYKE